jgi:hypothetical protein
MGGAFGNMIRRTAAQSAGSNLSSKIHADGSAKALLAKKESLPKIKVYTDQTVLYVGLKDFNRRDGVLSQNLTMKDLISPDLKEAWKDASVVILQYVGHPSIILKSRH